MNTFGPLTSTLPMAPGVQGLPSPSITRTDTPGSGMPTVPPMRSPSLGSYGFETSITVSLMP
ncbi:hypothetical protein D3C87_1623060 [compost metagenome]